MNMAETPARTTKSQAALAKLEAALAHLERALSGRKTELALAADVAEARADYERLAGATRGVEARLAGMREQLQTVLRN
jgi:hypothetical protein